MTDPIREAAEIAIDTLDRDYTNRDGTWTSREEAITFIEAAFKAQRAKLEQALRLHLAVGPDDPLLVEPVEQEVARVRQQLEQRDHEIVQLADQASEADRQRNAAIAKTEQVRQQLEAQHVTYMDNLTEIQMLKHDVATRDRTIAAMAAKAMSLVPGSKDVDEAWGKLAQVRRETLLEVADAANSMAQDDARNWCMQQAHASPPLVPTNPQWSCEGDFDNSIPGRMKVEQRLPPQEKP
jgi:hypothetical protein